MQHNQKTRQFFIIGLLLLISLTACEPFANPEPEGRPAPSVTMTVAPPTVVPASTLLEQALEARAIGEIDLAAEHLNTLLNTYPIAPEAYPAGYYLAESFARRGRWTSAVEAFKAVLTETRLDATLRARALFWLARGYEESGDWENANATYAQYRTLNTPLEPYAAMRQAAQFQALGRLPDAARAYADSAATSIAAGERAGSYEKAIALHSALGQDDIALQLYTQLLDMAEHPGYRARILTEAAALARGVGQTDTARAWLVEIVTQTPATTQAVAAAEQLLATNDPALSPAAAAHIFYVNEAYAAALPQFDAALSQLPADPPAEQTLDLQRLRGLTLRALGDFPRALEALAAAATALPDSETGRQAQLDWIQTLGQSGEVQQAADRYREYATRFADDPRAPVALDRAAQLLDRLDQSDAAQQVRLELGQRYPQSDLAQPALHGVALALYRNGRWDEAQSAWQVLAEHGRGVAQAQGAFWAARAAQQQQNDKQAQPLFEQAFAAAPDSYYGARAADELGLIFTPTTPLDMPGANDDWPAVEAWIETWHNPAADAQQTEDGDTKEAIQRAIELREVGLWIEAIGEWNHARDIAADNPHELLQVARQAHEHDMPYSALKAAEQLTTLAAEAAASAPETLRRLIFPVPYTRLIVAEAREQATDPRLVYALMRQESLFNPQATSWVGARGLAQVMPATGTGIAQRLGVSDFHTDDLYRPSVSVRFGTFYIGQQILAMEGSIHGGLAAYNGGPGNAQRWAGGSRVEDPDLFVEAIDYPETKNYVKLVYGYYKAYQRLYMLP